jgi:hypothetical protein
MEMAALSDHLTLAASDQFVQHGRDLITDLAKNRDAINTYAAVFEERGGQSRFTSQKIADPQTAEDQAFNDRLDELGIMALDIVVLRNDLDAFFDAGKSAKLNRLRTDYT